MCRAQDRPKRGLFGDIVEKDHHHALGVGCEGHAVRRGFEDRRLGEHLHLATDEHHHVQRVALALDVLPEVAAMAGGGSG